MPVYPLSANIPLRNTTVWPGYRLIETLKYGYGNVTIRPVQYDSSGLIWHLFDHPIQGVDQVTIAGSPAGSWDWFNGLDYTGRPCSFARLSTPASAENIEVSCRAMIHPATGELMVKPADVIWSVLTLARSTFPESRLDIFRRECTEFGLECHGVLDDHTRTTRSYLEEIKTSLGAVWSGAMPNLFRIYPRSTPADEPYYQDYNKRNMANVAAGSASSDLFTVLRVQYAYNFATGIPEEVIQLEAIEEVKKYRIEKEIELRWIQSGRMAAAIGERLLQFGARKKWGVSFSSGRPTPSGGYSTFEHPIIPVSGSTMVMGSSASPSDPDGDYEIKIPVGAVPTIEITQQSEKF